MPAITPVVALSPTIIYRLVILSSVVSTTSRLSHKAKGWTILRTRRRTLIHNSPLCMDDETKKEKLFII
jgi:hypothetical protein